MKKIILGLVGLSLLVQAIPANAEGDGQANDVVGVGSNTNFAAVNFLADGDNLGNLGFNTGSPHRRLVSVDPTGDAIGRATTSLNTTAVLRAGRAPVTRPNGSIPGIDFLNLGVTSTLAQLYSATGSVRTWGDVPGYNGHTPGAAIKPVLPQRGSGTFTWFNIELRAGNGGVEIVYRDDVIIAEEHDPTPIQFDPNAIGPFSAARVRLLNTGYFGATMQSSVRLQAPPANPEAFMRGFPLFILVRESSVSDHTGADGIAFPWRGTGVAAQNWVEALFGPPDVPTGSPGGFLARASLARPLVEAAGFTYVYHDLGICQG